MFATCLIQKLSLVKKKKLIRESRRKASTRAEHSLKRARWVCFKVKQGVKRLYFVVIWFENYRTETFSNYIGSRLLKLYFPEVHLAIKVYMLNYFYLKDIFASVLILVLCMASTINNNHPYETDGHFKKFNILPYEDYCFFFFLKKKFKEQEMKQ